MLRFFAIPTALLFLLTIGLVRAAPGDESAVDQYHASVRMAVEKIPLDVDGWRGEQVALPQSATNLLRPNALLARHYVDEGRGLSATLMVVQCRDARDMAGHYPPRCYPANGWLAPDEQAVSTATTRGQDLRRYRFRRVAGRSESEISVYSLFALPTGELTVSMDDVRRASADYQHRKFGAAQLQVLLDDRLSMEQQQSVLDEMYEIARPTIEQVLGAAGAESEREGGDQ